MRFNNHSHQNTRSQCPLNIRETIQFTSSPVSPPNSSKALFSQLWGQETSSALFPSLRQQLSHCVSPRSSWRNSPKKLASTTRRAVRKTNSSFVIIVQNKLSTLGDHFDLTDPATAPTVLILVLVAPLTVRIMWRIPGLGLPQRPLVTEWGTSSRGLPLPPPLNYRSAAIM